MSDTFSEVMEQLQAQYGDALQHMPLPEGVPEYVRERVLAGDSETLLFMLKLSWMFGAQAGQAATQTRVTRVPSAQA